MGESLKCIQNWIHMKAVNIRSIEKVKNEWREMIFSDFPENKYVNPEAVEKNCEKYDEEDLDICEVVSS